ncbi:MAG: cation:proton antiporter [Acidobacteria bacterium]|nr:cation:proton antiporter [Acidobacteriota bacterium]
MAPLAIEQHGGEGVLLGLLIIFASAKLMAELFERLRQPAVIGEIFAGILIGPSVLKWVEPTEITNVLAEVGVIFLLFTVGLDTQTRDLFRVGKRALAVAVLGVIVPFLIGYLLMEWLGYDWLGDHSKIESIFVGAAMVATSVGITARVLGDMGLLHLEVSRIILGAAVIDDVLGLIVLAVVSSLAEGGIDYLQIGITAGLAIGFTAFVAIVGGRVVTRVSHRVQNLRLKESHFHFALITCLGLSVVASRIGIAAIIGAFLAGMMFAAESRDTGLLHRSEAVMEFFVPFFLVNIGMQLQVESFLSTQVIWLAVIVTAAALFGKVVGCGAAMFGKKWKEVLQVGVGMAPRGEVGIVVAQIGLGLHTISNEMYGIVLFMAIMTTMIAPPLLKVLFREEQRTLGSEGGQSDEAVILG